MSVRSTWPSAPSCTRTTAAALIPHAMRSRTSSRSRSLAGRRSRLTGPESGRACRRSETLLFDGIAQLIQNRLGRREVVGVDGLLHELFVVRREALHRHLGL